MQPLFLTTLFYALMLAGFSGATRPATPGLKYLYTVKITGGAGVNVGNGPRGLRVIYPILGGAFSGPKLNGTISSLRLLTNTAHPNVEPGTVLPIGGDWSLTDSTGTLTADVRQTFATDDGAFIQVFETGSTQPDGTAFVRLAYETGSAKYSWLNSIVAVGIIHPLSASELQIDTWQVRVLLRIL